VVLVKAGVSSFTENGCVDELGEEHQADIIICATGFNTSFIPRFPIIGRGGKNLKDIWSASNPESYMGIGVSDMPNFLMFLGPYSAVANGPTMSAIGEITLHE
jgi:cation diffusion facilitator CzcD-associated flavoprotein CzcO